MKATAGIFLLIAISPAAADLTNIDTPVNMVNYHVRIDAAGRSRTHATLFWNYADSNTHRRADFLIPSLSESDFELGGAVTYNIYEKVEGHDSLLGSGNYYLRFPGGKDAGVSFVLKAYPSGARVESGTAMKAVDIEIPFDMHSPANIGFSTLESRRATRNQLITRALPSHIKSRFESLEELDEYFRTSTDSLEGYWKYLDRDIDTQKAAAGALYRLACVGEGDGSYTLLYIDGDTSGTWQALEIKASLQPTPFINHYDLVWIRQDGSRDSVDTSADIEVDGQVLRVNFPLLNSSMRFRKE